MLLDKRVFVYRYAPGASQEDYALHPAWPSGIMMNIQPASPQLTALTEGQFFKTYKAFTLASGIVETYKVIPSGTSEEYLVRGRERFDYGSGQHYELLLERGTR